MSKHRFDFGKALAQARISLRPLLTRRARAQHARAAEAKGSQRRRPDPERPAAKAPVDKVQRRRPRLDEDGPPRDIRAPRAKAKDHAHLQARAKALKKKVASAKASVKAKRKSGRPKPPTGRVEALGWFALAAVILAWPHREGLLGKPRDPDAPPLFPGLSRTAGAAQTAAASMREPGRGRDAQNPRQIPLEGWKDILARTWHDFNEDRITSVAGGVTFFGLLALFPAMAAFVSLYGLFADVATAQKQLSLLAGVLPADALTMVGQEMIRLAAARHTGLGFAFIVGLLVSLWSANAGIKALFEGLNIAFEEREARGFVKLNLVSFAFTLGAIAFLMIALAAVVVAPVVMGVFGIGAGTVVPVLRWPLLFALVTGALAALYRYGPSRAHERWKWVSWGSVIAAALWIVASLLFSAYVSHFAHYDKTYGSLGAVIGFMSWMWISTIVVLFGAELNSEIEHQTAVDTTTGAPKPMGARGAKMADTLGAARAGKKRG